MWSCSFHICSAWRTWMRINVVQTGDHRSNTFIMRVHVSCGFGCLNVHTHLKLCRLCFKSLKWLCFCVLLYLWRVLCVVFCCSCWIFIISCLYLYVQGLWFCFCQIVIFQSQVLYAISITFSNKMTVIHPLLKMKTLCFSSFSFQGDPSFLI